MDKILNYIGLARRAGFLISGTDGVIESLKNKAKIVFVASDASSATIDKIEKKCFFYHVSCIKIFNTTDLALASGLINPKVIAVSDRGMSDEILKLLKERGGSYESF